jgi:hypothetical protein
MYYADYNNSNEVDEITKRLKKEYEDNITLSYSNNNNKSIPIENSYNNNLAPFCNMSFGGLIKKSKTSTIVIPVNADLEYDSDCKMGYNTTLLIPITVPEITPNSSVVIIPIVSQQKVDNSNKNIITTTTQQTILEAKVVNDKISVSPLTDIKNISDNTKIVTTVANLNETEKKTEATAITSLAIQPIENKRVVTETTITNTDTSGTDIKTNTNLSISQLCLNGTIQCDVQQNVDTIKSNKNDNYVTFSQSTRTIVDLSSGEILLYGKNEEKKLQTIPTKFVNIDISNNIDNSENKINLANDNNSLKVEIPINAPTIVKINNSGEVINTTSEPIKINTKEPFIIETLIERFTLGDVEGYSITSFAQDIINGSKQYLPTINNPVFTRT